MKPRLELNYFGLNQKARNEVMLKLRVGNSIQVSTWEAGIQSLGSSLVPLRVCVVRKLGLGAELGIEPRHSEANAHPSRMFLVHLPLLILVLSSTGGTEQRPQQAQVGQNSP